MSVVDSKTKIEEIEEIKPFLEAAGEEDYKPGENARDMAVGQTQGRKIIISDQNENEASYNIIAQIIAEELSDYQLRVPKVSYDQKGKMPNTENTGVLLSEDVTQRYPEHDHKESLIDTFAFETLMGQADILENTEYDENGVYAFDFDESGKNPEGVYEAIKSEAQTIARELSVDENIESYDLIGQRAIEMADTLNLDKLQQEAYQRDVQEAAYQEIKENIETARQQNACGKIFEPQSEYDAGVELL